MEKRRRARINNCLNELKTLILDAMKKDVSSYLCLIYNICSVISIEKKIMSYGNLHILFIEINMACN